MIADGQSTFNLIFGYKNNTVPTNKYVMLSNYFY